MKKYAFLSFCFLTSLFGNPTGASVIQGSISQEKVSNEHLVVTADSDFTLIHWDQFNVRGGEVTHFQLPNEIATIINRDTSGLPSHILGTLSCNGTMVIINPLGIQVGESGALAANHLLASALDMDEKTMFLEDGQVFKGGEGIIDNRGTITSRNGHIVLLGNSVHNSGLIHAHGGDVIVGAAPELIFFGSGIRPIVIRGSTSSGSSFTSSGNIFGDNVDITTCINPFAQAINLSGTTATREGTDDIGTLRITSGGNITLDGYTYGNVDIAARDILVTSNAKLDASHPTTPGNIDMISSARICISKNALLTTEACIKGNGGHINLIAEAATLQAGTCSTMGGPEGGHGGDIELSGKHFVAAPGDIDRQALHEDFSPGKLILDPESDIVLSTREDTNYDILNRTFTPNQDNMNLSVQALANELQKGPVVITTTYPGPLAAKGSITLEEAAPLLYTSDYDLTLRCYSDQAISIHSPIENAGRGSLIFECPTGSVNVHASIQSQGDINIGSVDNPIGQSIAISPESADLSLSCIDQGNLSLCAKQAVALNTNEAGSLQLSSEQGSITLASSTGITMVAEEAPLHIKAGAGGLHLKNIAPEHEPSVTIAAHSGAITCTAQQGDISFDHIDDLRFISYDQPILLATEQSNLHLNTSGSVLVEAELAPTSIQIGGKLDATVKHNLLLQASHAPVHVSSTDDQKWNIHGNMLLYGGQSSALVDGEKHAQISIKEALLLDANMPLGSGIDNSEGLTLFVGSDLLMEGGSFIGQEMDSLTASVGGSIRCGDEASERCTSHVTAGRVELSTNGRLSLKGRSQIRALNQGLHITANAPITLFEQTALTASKGLVDVKSLTGHIALYDQAQVAALEDSVSMIAKSSIFLYDKTKVSSHGPHGMNLVCDFGKQVGSGRFVLAKDAKVNSSQAPLNIFAASQSYNRIEGTLNDVTYIATPTYFSNSQEAWGVNFIGYKEPQPLNMDPVTEQIPLLKYVEVPQTPAFQVFYKEVAPIAVGTSLLANSALKPTVTGYASPSISEMMRDLHDYDAYLWAVAEFYTTTSDELIHEYPHIPQLHSCPRFTIHYLDRKSPYLRNLIENNL